MINVAFIHIKHSKDKPLKSAPKLKGVINKMPVQNKYTCKT